MSWMRELFRDFFPAQELNRLDAAMERRRSRAAAERIDLRAHILEVEDDLARLALVVHALAETCLKKGVLTREEIAAMMAKVDLLDGVADGKLDPSVMRPVDEPPPPSTGAHGQPESPPA
jgi:hypothetical protein